MTFVSLFRPSGTKKGNTVRYKRCKLADGFLLPQGEGQDEGKKEWDTLFDSLTLALSRREREF